jgi:hypothetical protein
MYRLNNYIIKIALGGLLLFTIIGCEKDETIDASQIINYVVMDPFEGSIEFGDAIQDTVYYYFNDNNKMLKIRYDYALIQGDVKLDKIDSVNCIYYVSENHLSMTIETTDFYVPYFGKDFNEWKILELNSDTLIIDQYFNGTKVGHFGFCVFEK